MNQYVIAIDQGTTSTRAIVFDHSGNIVSSGQMEHEQIFPQAGWVEHDPAGDLGQHPRGHRLGPVQGEPDPARHRRRRHHQPARNSRRMGQDHRPGRLQRHRLAGHPHPAHRRRAGQGRRTGPLQAEGRACRWPPTSPAPRSSGSWTTSKAPGQRPRPATWSSATPTAGCCGTSPAACDGGVHVTDVTNASRTMFMDLETLHWDQEILDAFGVPASMMPAIKSSSEVYGTVHTSQLLREVPVAGILGDQQAATFGQAAFDSRRSQEHLRHRLLPDLQHRRGDRPLQERAADHAWATSSATRHRTTRWKVPSPSPDPSSSGCGTTSA